jgi:hypothetical protein
MMHKIDELAFWIWKVSERLLSYLDRHPILSRMPRYVVISLVFLIFFPLLVFDVIGDRWADYRGLDFYERYYGVRWPPERHMPRVSTEVNWKREGDDQDGQSSIQGVEVFPLVDEWHCRLA